MRSRSSWTIRVVAAAATFAAGFGLAILATGAGDDRPATAVATPAQAFIGTKGRSDDLPTTELYRRVSPAVVSVGAVKRTLVYDDPFADFFRPFFVQPRMLRQRTPYLGSGFLIDRDGHVITNYHVIDDAEEVFVTLTDGREVPAEVLEGDRVIDVALLKIDLPAGELPAPIDLGDSAAMEIGETVMALGNPFGNLLSDPRPTITRGVVSALHRDFRPDSRNLRVYQDMIQTDAAINPGNSGGPLVDARGRVVGVNTFIVSRGGGSNGIGFAIPINRVRNFVDEVLEYGRLRPMQIDFGVMTLSTPRVRGAIVNFVESGAGADRAGLRVGDVITAIDGRRITNREDLVLQLASKQVGTEVVMTVLSRSGEREVTYTLSEAVEARRR